MLPFVLKCLLIASLLLAAAGTLWAQPLDSPEKQAAGHFEKGVRLYKEGRFAEAIRAYTAAHHLAPHPDSLFNIARCHENLGNYSRALEFYRKVLAKTKDPRGQADISRRIRRLTTRPVKIFVTSQPSGARVTVDGRQGPVEGNTPLVLHLKPGEHVLMVRKPGYHLAARRVVVAVAREQTVEQVLHPLPGSCPKPRPPCPKSKPCPRLELADVENLHLQLAALLAYGITVDRPSSGGPGFQLYFLYKRLMVGAHFIWLPVGEQAVSLDDDNLSGKRVRYHEIQQRWLLMQVEGGYVFPWESFFLYATGGLGISMDRVSYLGRELEPDLAKPGSYKLKTTPPDKDDKTSYYDVTDFKEETAFAWSIGGGIQAMATTWMSVGAALRFGMIHGYRAEKDNPGNSQNEDVPYGIIWGTLAFHL